jgi:hypothetical protein
VCLSEKSCSVPEYLSIPCKVRVATDQATVCVRRDILKCMDQVDSSGGHMVVIIELFVPDVIVSHVASGTTSQQWPFHF